MATASTNGHPKPYPDLTIDELRAKRDRALLAYEAHILESAIDDYADFGGSDLLFQMRYRDADGTQWAPPNVPSDRRHGGNWPIWRTDQDLAFFRQKSRILCEGNTFAKGTLKNLINYTIGVGFAYECKLKDQLKSVQGLQADQRFAPLVEATQRVVDQFLELNRWNTKVDPRQEYACTGNREREAYRRVKRDGEAFIRFFYGAEGRTYVRFVEPEQVWNPAGGTYTNGWSYGIRHQIQPFEDVETPIEYYVVPQDPTTAMDESAKAKLLGSGELVPACEMVHIKNVDADAALKRGTPEFILDTADAFMRAQKLQRNLSTASAVRAATAEIWQHQTGTKDQLNALAQGYAQRQYTDPTTNRTITQEKIFPGAIRRLPQGIESVPVTADPGASGLVSVVQGDLRQAITGFCAPEYFTGDASNANYASTNVAGAPFVRASESEQEHFKQAFLRCIWKAIQHAIASDKLPREVIDLVEIEVDAPKVLVRDELQRAQEDQIAITTGWKSAQTAAVERGLDWDTETQRMSEQAERMGMMGGGQDLGGMIGDMGGQVRESLWESDLDSHGGPLLKKWFSGSKMKTDVPPQFWASHGSLMKPWGNGGVPHYPIKFYHYSKTPLTEFDPEKGGGWMSFAHDKEHAENFGEHPHEVYLHVRKPIDLRHFDAEESDPLEVSSHLAKHGIRVDLGKHPQPLTQMLAPHRANIKSQAIAKGHDALLMNDSYHGRPAEEVAVFHPHQIKATTSSGFDRGSRNIYESAEWDESKHARNHGEFASKPGEGAATKDKPSGGSHPFATISRRGRRVLNLLAKRGKTLLSGAKSAEHAAHKFATAQMEKLPKPIRMTIAGVYHVAFATYTAAQKAAQAVAKERGLDEKQVANLASALAAADIVMGGKVLPASLGAAGLGPLAGVASFVPVASLGYLAFSTARDPWATLKAAAKAVEKVAGKVKRHAEGEGDTDLVAVLADHAGDDAFLAAFVVALDKTQDTEQALQVASKACPKTVRESEWDESKHPRKDNGEFGSGGDDESEAKITKHAAAHDEAASNAFADSRGKIDGIAEELKDGNIDAETAADDATKLMHLDADSHAFDEILHELTSAMAGAAADFDNDDAGYDETVSTAHEHADEAIGKLRSLYTRIASEAEQNANELFGNTAPKSYDELEREMLAATNELEGVFRSMVDVVDEHAYDQDGESGVESLYDDHKHSVEDYSEAIHSALRKYFHACSTAHVQESFAGTRSDDTETRTHAVWAAHAYGWRGGTQKHVADEIAKHKADPEHAKAVFHHLAHYNVEHEKKHGKPRIPHEHIAEVAHILKTKHSLDVGHP